MSHCLIYYRLFGADRLKFTQRPTFTPFLTEIDPEIWQACSMMPYPAVDDFLFFATYLGLTRIFFPAENTYISSTACVGLIEPVPNFGVYPKKRREFGHLCENMCNWRN